MASEPPVTPEKKSHTGLIVTIVLIVIVVLLALFFGLYFGLRNKGDDIPDEVNPDPDIVEPGPEDPNSEGDDGETSHTEHSWVWECDDEGHWQVCSVCGETTTKNSHTLSYTKGNDTSHTVKCDTCGYEATKEHTLEYVSDGTAGHHQVCSECEYTTATVSHVLGSYISDGDDGHYQECSMCDYKSEGNHTWTETSTTPATCTTEGATYYTCQLCGATKTEEIPALGHEWSSGWSYDATNHWHACTREGCTAKNDETTHTLGEQTKNTDGNYCQTCSVCGYSTEPVAPVATSISVTGDDDLVVHYNNALDDSEPETLDLRSTITVTILDQFNNEYTGTNGSEYTLSTERDCISLSEAGVVTGVSEGTAIVTVTSVANSSLTEDIEIEVTEKEYEVESISVSLSGTTNDDGYILLDWGATSGELQVTFNPSYATVQTYEVTPNDDTGLFTYDETTNTFTHTKLNTGTETFTITATDQSNSASTTITLECDPVIDEPYEVVWKEDTLPETIAKGESIENLDDYVEVHFNHTGQDEHEYEDDTYTLSYVGSTGVDISGTNVTFTGDGGTSVYITVTATPAHDSELSQTLYAVSSGIIITQAVTGLSLNYSEYVFKPLKDDNSMNLEATFSPDDYYPKDQVTDISWTLEGDTREYISITPGEEDATKCAVSLTETGLALENDQYIDGITVTASTNPEYGNFTCDIIISTYDFATDSWETINEVSSQGIASKAYDVGDTKENVYIRNGDYEIRIDDFDHDDLTDSSDTSYNSNNGKAAITCEMVDCISLTHNMNSSRTSSGGWYSCGMRSYLSDTVLPTLDGDLQSVIKKVDKKSLAGGTSTSLGETASDSLFLLAKVEVDGTTSNGYKDEGTQYAYWSEHNTDSDRIKYRSGSADRWWLRSSYLGMSNCFSYVTPSGGDGGGYADTSYGTSFAFCI